MSEWVRRRLARPVPMRLFSWAHQWWGLMQSPCDSGTIFGCSVSSFPWIIGGLVVLLLLLVGLWVGLNFYGRWRGAPKAPAPGKPVPKPVAAGSPLQPSNTPPAPAKPKEEKPQPAKPSPLQLRVVDAPGLKATSFANGEARSDFGELITDVVLTGDGWKKLESKLPGGGGIGGLYVREVRGGGGFEALAVETKTNEAAHNPATMSDAAVEQALGLLYAQGAFGASINEAVANELIRGVRAGAPFFRKELWRHNLSSGVTGVTQLGPDGELRASTMRSHARLIAGAYASLKQLDRSGSLLGRGVDPGA